MYKKFVRWNIPLHLHCMQGCMAYWLPQCTHFEYLALWNKLFSMAQRVNSLVSALWLEFHQPWPLTIKFLTDSQDVLWLWYYFNHSLINDISVSHILVTWSTYRKIYIHINLMMVHLSAMLKKYFVKNNITCTTQTKTKVCFRYTIVQKLDCHNN